MASTPDVEGRRARMLAEMPLVEQQLVRSNGYASLRGARSALRSAYRLGLCKREDGYWKRTDAGTAFVERVLGPSAQLTQG